MLNISKQFGARVQELRKAYGITQAELAEFLGVEDVTISRIETGLRFPRLENIEKIANILNVEIKELFNFKHHTSRKELLNYINSKLKGVNDKDLKYFKKMLDAYLESNA